jgi:hypothetical protein
MTDSDDTSTSDTGTGQTGTSTSTGTGDTSTSQSDRHLDAQPTVAENSAVSAGRNPRRSRRPSPDRYQLSTDTGVV